MTSNSSNNNFSSYFQTKKSSKNSNSGVYFDENNSIRSSTFLSDPKTNQRQKNQNQNESFVESEEEFNLDFGFLNQEITSLVQRKNSKR